MRGVPGLVAHGAADPVPELGVEQVMADADA